MAAWDDSIDRQAIFARRAKLVASALSGLTITSAAQAQPAAEPPPTGCEAELTPQKKAEASVLFDEARDAANRGEIPRAAAMMKRVYELYPHEKVALALMRILVLQGRHQAAADIGLAQARCGGDIEKIREEMAEIEAKSARLTIVVTGDDVANGELKVDDDVVPWERLASGVLVSAGRHRVVYRRVSGRSVEHNVEVVAGDRTDGTLVAPDDVPPHPCLSPCLSPPPPDDKPFVRLEAGLIGPFVAAVPDAPANALFGGGARVSFSVALIDKLWLEGGVFSTFMGDETARTVWLGTSPVVRFYFNGTIGIGGGFAGGYVFDLTPEDELGFIRSSPFFGPVLAPISLRYEHVSISLTVPVLFSDTVSRGVHALRPSVVAPMVSFTFGGTVADKPGYDGGYARGPWIVR